ncbi:hypothetical protein FB645_003774 [Coemansia sp. IMI 203386]|nr:hypothetical protein FB645_003774 [Coemansia sp. IMI 203386]
MSSRAVKRLLKERGVDELSEAASRLEAATPEKEVTENTSSKTNIFDLLMGGGDDDQEETGEEEDEGQRSEGEKQSVKPQQVAKVSVATDEAEVNSEDRKKSKNKSKKGKGKNKSKGKGRAKAATAGNANDLSMAEFEAQLDAIQSQQGESTDSGSVKHVDSAQKKGKGAAIGVQLSREQQQNRALLVVDSKHLDSQAEIRRMFGSGAAKSNNASQQVRGRVMQASRLKRMTLTQPKATWPPMRASPGIEMKQLSVDEKSDKQMVETMKNDPTGGTWFALQHTTRFRTIQLEFLGAVESHNPDAISRIVYHYPYHVDALLQLSEILKQTGGDFGEAGELVERALYAFECGFAPRFSPTNGMGRLDFRRVESRGLFLALFRHMQFMARRGCWRTAFEVNKALLSLDPVQDPYGALLTLDFHALKSKQYDYVCQFADEWTWSSVELPNLAYSRALAEFMLEGGGKKGKERSRDTGERSSSSSTDLLVEAILVFPTAIPPLLSKANIDVDPVILTHPYFQDEHIPDTTELTHMQLAVQMFVERHKSLYRTPETGRWLQEGLLLALERIALAEATGIDDATSERSRAAKRRLCTYVVPENISRHVLVADMESMKAGLPEHIRSAESFAFDPLPPKDSINVYDEFLGMGVAADRIPGGFVEVDGEMIDLEELQQGNAGYIAQLIDRLRRNLGIAAEEDIVDPGTSEDELDQDWSDHGESDLDDGVPE